MGWANDGDDGDGGGGVWEEGVRIRVILVENNEYECRPS